MQSDSQTLSKKQCFKCPSVVDWKKFSTNVAIIFGDSSTRPYPKVVFHPAMRCVEGWSEEGFSETAIGHWDCQSISLLKISFFGMEFLYIIYIYITYPHIHFYKRIPTLPLVSVLCLSDLSGAPGFRICFFSFGRQCFINGIARASNPKQWRMMRWINMRYCNFWMSFSTFCFFDSPRKKLSSNKPWPRKGLKDIAPTYYIE